MIIYSDSTAIAAPLLAEMTVGGIAATFAYFAGLNTYEIYFAGCLGSTLTSFGVLIQKIRNYEDNTNITNHTQT